MLNQEKFNEWCEQLKLSKQARQVIEQVRSSEPSRLVGGGRQNVSGRYPSYKMQRTIQFESHKVELPFIYQMEHDPDVLEFWDQPPSIKINHLSKNGRNLGYFYTPDFFVLRTNTVGWVECKTETELHRLFEKNPHRYLRDEDSQWRCPPVEQHASQFGFFFQVWSDAEINWVLHRNLEFLNDYLHG